MADSSRGHSVCCIDGYSEVLSEIISQGVYPHSFRVFDGLIDR